MASISDEELSKQQHRIKKMEVKATFEATQNEIRRQQDNIQHLRRENKELTQAKQQRAKGSSVSAEEFERKEADLLKTKLYEQRRKLDDIKENNDDKAGEIDHISQKVGELNKEAQPILDDNGPLAQKIRTLENRLDKSLIKHNEAMSIRRTYEQILKRLRDERVGFDNQLAAIEKTLKAKEHDYMELSNMAHDAHHAKEIAKSSVAQYKATLYEERRQRKKELDDRREFVKSRADQGTKAAEAARNKKEQEQIQQQKKQEEEERKRREQTQASDSIKAERDAEQWSSFADKYRQIKEVTGARNLKEVCEKWTSLDDARKQIDKEKALVERKNRDLQVLVDEHRQKVQDSKYQGTGQLGSRRIVDEFETHLTEALAQLEKSTHNYEHVSTQFAAVKAGVEHLAEKLSWYKDPPSAVSDENITTVLESCKAKLQTMMDETGTAGNEQPLEELLATADVELPAHNTRVKLPVEGMEEEEDRGKGDGKGDMDDAEDDPHDRVALKQMSLSAVDRAKKQKKKKGKKEEEEKAS